MSLLMGSEHWDWTKRPTGIWDRRPQGLGQPGAVFPPVQCMVCNSVGERVKDVIAVDFDQDLVLVCRRSEENPDKYVCDAVTRQPLVDWVSVPGVHVRPLPTELLREQEELALKRKGYRREKDGTISTGHPVE